MLADDVLGAQREECISPLPASYYSAFEAIERDPNNELVVCELEGKVVGVLQLTYIPNISRRGGCSHGRSSARARGAACWCSSPRTSGAATPSASTNRSVSPPPTKE